MSIPFDKINKKNHRLFANPCKQLPSVLYYIYISFVVEEWVPTHSSAMYRHFERAAQMLEKLEATLTPVVELQNYELYDIEYVKEGGGRILRLFIDKDEGIDIDDCERVSRAVEAVLDEQDLISGEYRLQVSSPGVERKIKKPAHFTRFIGHKMEVRLFAPHEPVSGRKKFTGILTAFANNQAILKTPEDDQSFTFDLQDISACKLIWDFSSNTKGGS